MDTLSSSSLMTTLKKAQQENRLEHQMQLLTCSRLLVLDEIGYLPMEPDEASLFFSVLPPGDTVV